MKSAKIITLGMAILLLAALSACPTKTPEFKPLTPELIEEFYNAAVEGEMDHLQLLLEEYPNLINSQESMFNLNALHGAAYGGHLDIVKYLISEGGDVNARSKGGNTPLVEAAAHNRADVTEYLLSHGAEVNAVNNDGEIPLHWAATRGATDTIEIMLRYGADVNLQDNDGVTPLQRAVQNGHFEAAGILQANGAI